MRVLFDQQPNIFRLCETKESSKSLHLRGLNQQIFALCLTSLGKLTEIFQLPTLLSSSLMTTALHGRVFLLDTAKSSETDP